MWDRYGISIKDSFLFNESSETDQNMQNEIKPWIKSVLKSATSGGMLF